jgi:transcriptional regulator with XRE-family HTH domain
MVESGINIIEGRENVCEDEIKEYVTRLQEALGDMSQVELKKLLAEQGYEITQGRLSHYIQGRNFPDPPVLAAIAKALGVSSDWLLGLTTEKLPVVDLEEMLATAKGESKVDKIMVKLPKEKQQQVLTYAEYLLAMEERNRFENDPQTNQGRRLKDLFESVDRMLGADSRKAVEKMAENKGLLTNNTP